MYDADGPEVWTGRPPPPLARGHFGGDQVGQVEGIEPRLELDGRGMQT